MNINRCASLPALVLLGGALISSPAHAQGSGAPAKDIRPPSPAEPGKPNVVGTAVLGFVLGAAALGVAMMPSKRTHQD